jgi:hypothetical protein
MIKELAAFGFLEAVADAVLADVSINPLRARPRALQTDGMPILILLIALGLTWLIEWAVAALVLRGSSRRLAFRVLLVNALTQPLAAAAILELDFDFWLVEAAVCMVEIPLYRLLVTKSWRQAFIISLVGNGLSAAASFLL